MPDDRRPTVEGGEQPEAHASPFPCLAGRGVIATRAGLAAVGAASTPAVPSIDLSSTT